MTFHLPSEHRSWQASTPRPPRPAGNLSRLAQLNADLLAAVASYRALSVEHTALEEAKFATPRVEAPPPSCLVVPSVYSFAGVVKRSGEVVMLDPVTTILDTAEKVSEHANGNAVLGAQLLAALDAWRTEEQRNNAAFLRASRREERAGARWEAAWRRVEKLELAILRLPLEGKAHLLQKIELQAKLMREADEEGARVAAKCIARDLKDKIGRLLH